MKFTSPVYSQVSGSVAGLTYAHNKSGLYSRARRVPVNPRTVFQQAARAALSALVGAWAATSLANRALWDAYAQVRTVLNPLGLPINLSGQQWYIKLNQPRLYAGDTLIGVPPIAIVQGALSPITLSVDATADTADITFSADAWALHVGGHLYVYLSRPQNPSVVFFAGPYRLAGQVDGAVVPPTSPATVPLPFPAAVGQQIFARIFASESDGNNTNEYRLSAVAV